MTDQTWRDRTECPECGLPRKSRKHATCAAAACHAAYRARVDRACVNAYADKRRADPGLMERQRASKQQRRVSLRPPAQLCVICQAAPRRAATRAMTCTSRVCQEEYRRRRWLIWWASLSDDERHHQRQRRSRKWQAMRKRLADDADARAAHKGRRADQRRRRILAKLWSDLQ